MSNLIRADVFLGLNRGSRFSVPGRVSHAPATISQPEAIGIIARTLNACAIPAATILPSFGLWNGTLEPGLVVSIIGDERQTSREDLAESVAGFVVRAIEDLAQDAALVVGTRGTYCYDADELSAFIDEAKIADKLTEIV